MGLINKGFYNGIKFHRIIPVLLRILSDLELYYPGRRPYGHRVLFRVNLGVHCLLSLGTSHPFEDEITRKLRFTGAGILAMVPPLAEVKV